MTGLGIGLGDKAHARGGPTDAGLTESEWGFRCVLGEITGINYHQNNK